jgi:hypothetical protein
MPAIVSSRSEQLTRRMNAGSSCVSTCMGGAQHERCCLTSIFKELYLLFISLGTHFIDWALRPSASTSSAMAAHANGSTTVLACAACIVTCFGTQHAAQQANWSRVAPPPWTIWLSERVGRMTCMSK